MAGYLDTARGGRFGFEFTLLRVGLGARPGPRRSAWAASQVFHLSYAIIPFDPGEIYRDREGSREAMGLAGYDPQQRKIWVYRRQLHFDRQNGDSLGMVLNIPDSPYPLKLELDPVKPAIAPPLSVPFRFYTSSRMAAKGTLKIGGENHGVAGEALFEHSWGKLPAGTGQLVRNRFLLQLSNGTDLHLFQSRRRDGSGRAINGGFMVLPEAQTVVLEHGDLDIDPGRHWTGQSGIRYPVQWRIRIPGRALILDLKPWRDDQETGGFLADWSGMVSISGSSGATPLTGFGHVQLWGYSPRKRNG